MGMIAASLSLSPARACHTGLFFLYRAFFSLGAEECPPPLLQRQESLAVSANVAEICTRSQSERK